MREILVELSIALASINVAIARLVVANRLVLRHRQHRHQVASDHLKPAMLDWIDGEGPPPTTVNDSERRAPITLLTKYGRPVTGAGRSEFTDLA